MKLLNGETGLGSTYSPYDDIDHFGRDAIRDRIQAQSPERRKGTTVEAGGQCSNMSLKNTPGSKSSTRQIQSFTKGASGEQTGHSKGSPLYVQMYVNYILFV